MKRAWVILIVFVVLVVIAMISVQPDETVSLEFAGYKGRWPESGWDAEFYLINRTHHSIFSFEGKDGKPSFLYQFKQTNEWKTGILGSNTQAREIKPGERVKFRANLMPQYITDLSPVTPKSPLIGPIHPPKDTAFRIGVFYSKTNRMEYPKDIAIRMKSLFKIKLTMADTFKPTVWSPEQISAPTNAPTSFD